MARLMIIANGKTLRPIRQSPKLAAVCQPFHGCMPTMFIARSMPGARKLLIIVIQVVIKMPRRTRTMLRKKKLFHTITPNKANGLMDP